MKEAIKLLMDNGYIIKGSSIIAPDCDSPLDAISIQDQLSDIGYRLEYIGDKLKIVEVEV